MAHSSGKVSREWPGMNQVALMLYFLKRLRRRTVPMWPAKRPGCLTIRYRLVLKIPEKKGRVMPYLD
jgi:hypothetical protein